MEDVQRSLARSGLAPERLVLELTETTDVADLPTAISHLGQLNDMGVILALDDFGTGYSSLDYLKRFPVHILKIDVEFVRDICTSAGDRAIVEGIINLARSFGLRTFAEGIESVEQQTIVAELGCDYGQGHLWERPSRAEDLPGIFGPSPSAVA